MKIRDLPNDPGPAAWNALLPPQDNYPELSGSRNSDWLVIGAGFAGFSAARRLQLICPDDKITILEAKRIAEGPAGRNSGFMIDLPHDLSSVNYGGTTDHDRDQIQLNRAAISFAGEMAKEFNLDAEAFVRCGKTNAAATQRGLRHNTNYAAHLTNLGEPHELLDERAMKDLTGSDYYLGGLFTPGTAMIQPAKFIGGVAHGLTQLGIRLFENSPVTALEKADGCWMATTPKGKVSAPKVILAVNGHAESFGFFKRRLLHVYLYASMTRAMNRSEVTRLGGAPVWGCTPADPLGSTLRRISGTGGDRIIVRNRVTYNPSLQVKDSRVKEFAYSHDKAFANRFPMLRDVTMEYRWGGRLCLSWNDVPAFGEIEKNLFSACCQNGLGTAKGTSSGILAAELATGTKSGLLEIMHQQKQPRMLPPKPFSWLGVNARMRWGEFRAGKEL